MQLRQDELLNCQITVNDLPQDLRPGTDLTSFFRSAVLASGQPLLAKDAALTFGVPWLSADANRDWFGRRFFYWKNGFPTDRLIGMAMSRVGRKLEEHKPVFDAIRTAIVGVDANREAILVSCGTAAEPFISRAAKLFGRSVVRITSEYADQSWDEFWSAVHRIPSRTAEEPNVFVSPLLSLPETTESTGSPSAPLCDRLLVGVVHRLLCPYVRGPVSYTHLTLPTIYSV